MAAINRWGFAPAGNGSATVTSISDSGATIPGCGETSQSSRAPISPSQVK